MLSRGRATLMGISQLVLTIAYWTLGLLGYASWTIFRLGQGGELTLADVQVALLFSSGFAVLSGYVVTVPLLYALFDHRRSWTLRALLNAGLFALSVGVFMLLVGDSPPGGSELSWALLGVAGVLAAEGTTRLLWGRLVSNQTGNEEAGRRAR